jgi:hypothetical protein
MRWPASRGSALLAIALGAFVGCVQARAQGSAVGSGPAQQGDGGPSSAPQSGPQSQLPPPFARDHHGRDGREGPPPGAGGATQSTLQADYEALRDEERQLQPLTRGVNIDEHTLFAHIDRLSQARAELEKANVHMLLLLRHELTPDQVSLLDERRPPPR